MQSMTKTFFCEDDQRYYIDRMFEFSRKSGADRCGQEQRQGLDRPITRTARPLGCADFVRRQEVIAGKQGKELPPKRPGRKPVHVN
jgi:hypothetical protein